ncbi:Adenylyltransferase and sulfurtransferase MOCS3 [Phytophthora cinnamomi]|uniref:Adenylyltransferase and sulfurtransferase MOCS3 n=1 Tax=Phytophthora cinnamomi TaxID=4785 RepID=UPI00355A8A3B|nr:Adenylyltransferase and sulfurtransferase MOCS3 [Phytophthora cinnamomi]
MATSAAPACSRCSALENELEELRVQNAQLRAQLEKHQKADESVAKRKEDKTTEDLAETLMYSPFSRAELQRYGRQMLVKEFGVQAQLKLRAASVLLIGVGGLGSPVAMYLAAMGVGTLAVVDGDHVDRSNLHRQVLHDEQGAKGREKKVDSAKRKLRELNPLVRCIAYPTRFTAANALTLVGEYDVVVDASDNVGTRYLVNDACSRRNKPLVSGSALGLEGQVTVFTYQEDENATGCYRRWKQSRLLRVSENLSLVCSAFTMRTTDNFVV